MLYSYKIKNNYTAIFHERLLQRTILTNNWKIMYKLYIGIINYENTKEISKQIKIQRNIVYLFK